MPTVSLTPNSTNLAYLESIVAEYKTRFFDYGNDGILLLHPENSSLLHLGDTSDNSIEAARVFLASSVHVRVQNLEKLGCTANPPCHNTSQSSNSNSDRRKILRNHLNLDVNIDVLSSPEKASSFFNAILSEVEMSDVFVLVRLHFSSLKRQWKKHLQSVVDMFEKPMQQKSIQLALSGTFDLISEEDRLFFLENSIQIEFVHDLVVDSFRFSEKTSAVVSHLAGMGFRVPLVWYVDNCNVNSILPLIDEAMYLNYNSGFSLPAFWYNVTMDYSRSNDLSPNSYLNLLVNAYERHQAYDDFLYPLNIFQLLSLKPGCRYFVKRSFYCRDSGQIVDYPRVNQNSSIETFFLRLFLWQRWIVSQKTTPAALTPVQRMESPSKD